MRFYIFFIVIILVSSKCIAQNNDTPTKSILQIYEDSMVVAMNGLLNEFDENNRIESCFSFIPLLAKSLKIEGSFDYPFDSLKLISRIYAPDKSFRIFSWLVQFNNSEYRYFGVLQHKDKKIGVIPFYDYTYNIKNLDTITSPKQWIGAVYYNMTMTKDRKNTYYTLFGWKGNNVFQITKVAEPIYFNKEKELIMGAPIFQMKDTLGKKTVVKNRQILEFKRDASITLNYSEDEKKIIFDHVVDENQKELMRGYACIPDGTYEGFEWKKRKWQYLPKVFTLVMSEPFYGKPIFEQKNLKNLPPMK